MSVESGYTIEPNASLSSADLSGADLSYANLSGADLSSADLSGADLIGAVLTDADLTGAVLSDANLSGADLSSADLSGADLTRASLIVADLSGADLTRADLTGAALSSTYLTRADLTGADLFGAVLTRADLTGADLSGADLTFADLARADLTGADLTGADLSNADLSGTDLSGADLTGVQSGRLWGALTLPTGYSVVNGQIVGLSIDTNGINDAAIIIAADASTTKDVATVSGAATHTDIDANNAANVFTAASDVSSTYGSYSVTTAGNWTYTLDNTNTTIQTLVNGQSTTDSITVTAEDGTTEDITITINSARYVMNAITGTEGDDTLTILADTNSIQAGAGNDTAVFSGNYADYTFSQSDSYLSILINNTSFQAVSLFGVEQLQFDDTTVSLTTTGSGEFQVSTTSPSKSDLGITLLTDGGFAITYQGWHGDDDTDYYAQLFYADGTKDGDEILSSVLWSGVVDIVTMPGVTVLNDGGYLASMRAKQLDDVNFNVYAQIFYADGTDNGDEFLVNTHTASHKAFSTNTALNGGGFVITWVSDGQDGDGFGIYAQLFNADGTKDGDELQVNTYTTSNQMTSFPVPSTVLVNQSIISLNDGGFVITWFSQGQDGDGDGVYAQRYDADGTAIGGEFQVNTYTTNGQSDPGATALNDGGFVITWMSDGQDGDGDGVYAQRYDADGTAIGGEFQVNTYTTNGQGYQSIAALNDGGFVIAWVSTDENGAGEGIYAQLYDSEGNPLGTVTLNAVITGTSADDILQGSDGMDNISTLEGADVVYALAGEDDITLTADATWGTGYSANNVSNDNSIGTNEKISLEDLNKFSDVIDGGDDVDTLILTTGNDAFFIDDVYSDHHSSLTLSSTTQGTDSIARIIDLEAIRAGEGNDIVDLTSANFILTDAIKIYGEAGDDTLWGSNGNDTIDGGEDNDTLFGGAGNDSLTGGTGADVFQFTATSGSDVITDLSAIDSIELYYRAEDNHTNADLGLVSGVLTWNTSDSNNVSIDLSNTITSSDFSEVDNLITFVEIV